MKTRIALIGLIFAGAGRADDAYPKAELLAESSLIAKVEDDANFIVLDAREKPKFEKGHIPLARWVDHTSWAKAFDNGKDADGWSQRISELGISEASKVIVYDDAFNKDAARIWWILRYWGVKDVRLLNGGWVFWEQSKLPMQKESVKLVATEFKAVAHDEKLVTKEQLIKAVGEGKWQIVDARSEKEHCGIEAMNNKKAGSMPGAKHLEWIDLLDKETHRFKSPAELKKLFDAAGIKLTEPTATHCQAGGRAAVMSFGMELMGAPAVRTYYKSWGEWGNADDTPVVKPKKK